MNVFHSRALLRVLASLSLIALCASPATARPQSRTRPPAAVAAPEPAPTPAAPAAPAPVVEEAPQAWSPLWISEASSAEARRLMGAPAKQAEQGEHDHAAMMKEPAADAPSKAAAVATSEARNNESAAEAMVDISSHSGKKTVWLRRGDDPATAPIMKANGERATLRLLGTDGKGWDVDFADNGKGFMQAKIDLPAMGFYNAYLTRQAVRGGALEVEVAKAELLKANCCSKRDFDLYKSASDDSLPIELIREHKPDEKVMTRIQSGDRSVYFVRSFGKPVEGAVVTIQTQEGWRKRAFTDAQGRVEFTLVRDYFPDWSDFNKRKTGSFLVLAEVERPNAGALDGKPYATTRYRTSMAGRYYPATYDYQSYAWGLGVVLFAVALGALSVWIYRRNRVKPFKETRFDERTA